jgi:hypothetical protein
MSERTFVIALSERGDVLWVRIVKERGVVVDYALRYETVINGEVVQVVPCDGSHGRGHCHWVDSDGKRAQRLWAREGLDLGDALTEQIEDLAANWQRYRDDSVSERSLPKKRGKQRRRGNRGRR